MGTPVVVFIGPNESNTGDVLVLDYGSVQNLDAYMNYPFVRVVDGVKYGVSCLLGFENLDG